MSKKTLINTINIIVFITAIIYLGLLSLILPHSAESETERRELSPRPEFSVASYLDKSYTRAYDDYYADAFPVRDHLIKLSYMLDSIKGIEGEVKLYQSNIQESQKPIADPEVDSTQPSQPAPPSEPSVPPSSSSQEPSEPSAVSESSSSSEPPAPSEPPQEQSEPTTPTDAVDENAYINNNIFIYKGAAYQLFFGDNASAESFANIVSSYAAELPGVNVYAQVIPQPFNFYLPQRYKKMGRDELDYANFYQSKLTNGAKGVKVYQQLEQHKEDYLYFRTDTHWTARGAYCAYLAFCEEAGFEPVPLEQMERRVVPGDFLGYLYTITMDHNLAENPDYVEYFIPSGLVKTEAFLSSQGASSLMTLPSLWAEDRRGGNSYSTFIYGDLPYMRVTTSAGTGRSALLIKDSYGNAFAPYLISHYDTLHILDERHYPYSVYELIEREGIDDVIISQSSYSANAASHQRNLQKIKTGHTGLPLPDFDAPPAVSEATETPAEQEQNGQNQDDTAE